MALHASRTFDANADGPYSSYQPSNPEIMELLSRDPNARDDKHPYQVGCWQRREGGGGGRGEGMGPVRHEPSREP
jgi:hypothetical protein